MLKEVSSIYKPLNYDLQFLLKNFSYYDIKINQDHEIIDIDGSKNKKNYPGDELLSYKEQELEALVIRIKYPQRTISDYEEESLPRGAYYCNGVMDIDYANILNSNLLAHEIGHRIIGYGHHETQKCVMDIWPPKAKFCQECSEILTKLKEE